jgi:hypothetical protein
VNTKELNKALEIGDFLNYAEQDIYAARREVKGLHYQRQRLESAIQWISKAIIRNELRLSNMGEKPKNVLIVSKLTGQITMFDRSNYERYIADCKELGLQPEFTELGRK